MWSLGPTCQKASKEMIRPPVSYLSPLIITPSPPSLSPRQPSSSSSRLSSSPVPWICRLSFLVFSRCFCSAFPGDVCGLCFPEHVPTHHTGGNGVAAEIRMLYGSAALSHRTVKNYGMGYDWRKIQRLDYQESTWAISLRNEYCSPACKTGRSRHTMERLVSCDFDRSHVRDSFCTVCLRAFASGRCLDHSVHHSVDEQPNIQILNIVRHDGWLLIPDQQLPPDLTSGVRRVKLGDGTFAVPLRPRLLPIHDGDYVCTRSDCEEGVQFAANVCNILSKFFAHLVPDQEGQALIWLCNVRAASSLSLVASTCLKLECLGGLLLLVVYLVAV